MLCSQRNSKFSLKLVLSLVRRLKAHGTIERLQRTKNDPRCVLAECLWAIDDAENEVLGRLTQEIESTFGTRSDMQALESYHAGFIDGMAAGEAVLLAFLASIAGETDFSFFVDGEECQKFEEGARSIAKDVYRSHGVKGCAGRLTQSRLCQILQSPISLDDATEEGDLFLEASEEEPQEQDDDD